MHLPNLRVLACLNPRAFRNAPPAEPDIARTFLRWTFLRAVFHRGYVLTCGLYFVIIAHLSAAQIVVLATVMSLTLGLSDVPTGVWSDAFSRKWPLVIGHGLLAAGMIMTGLVTAYPLILITQVLWGLGWAFSSGADVAWLTDELARPDRIDRLLTTRARRDLAGSATGMLAFGLLAWACGLATAVVVSGAGTAAAGLFVAARFAEDNFTPVPERRWSAALSIFRRGLTLSLRDREIRLVLVATMIINGAGVVSSLFPRQLVDVGFPGDPIPWYTGILIVAFGVGALGLRFVEARIHGPGVARRTYALACALGGAGLVVLARAPDAIVGGLGVVLASGIAFNVTRAVSVVWVNRRTTSDVRATVHSFLSQAECAGEVVGGAGLALVARTAGISATLITSGILFACAAAMVARSRSDRLNTSAGWRPRRGQGRVRRL
jgi:MFS transporter, DHA3 family, tetracycline resistance protein